MDAKTFECMNDKVKRFNEAQAKIKTIKERILMIEKYGVGSLYFIPRNIGNYNSIPHLDESLLKETLIKLMSDKIEALEKEQSEI